VTGSSFFRLVLLNREGKAALDAVADAFKDLQARTWWWRLHRRRANSAKSGYTDKLGLVDGARGERRALPADEGVSPAMLGRRGSPSYRPLVPNDSPANRSQNRRIEIAPPPPIHASRRRRAE